ncbi:MAG: GNAT family N-acetyltransferase [Anaerolineae bacterium]|nr:GNAT family N-acetyltransferase [Anaerolineae bacterium]MCI0608099.1 GNAT family N-acetyltransferase [Anaerolineae bacterium]
MVSAENDPRRAGTIWAFDLDQPIPIIKPLIDATFFRVGPESITELASVMSAINSAEMVKRFETGRRCYVAKVDNKITTYGWVSFNEEFIGELNLRLRLLPGEAYIWDCATLPSFQRNHLYSALLTYILMDLSTGQLQRVWIGADLDNVASQRGIARAGFQYVADLVVVRVLALRQVWVQGRPDVPESLVAEARRAFLNNRDKVWSDARTSAASR